MPLTPDLPQRFADRMGQIAGPDFPTDLGVAVSGGGDSMAMLHLAAGWARVYGVRLRVVTIDHGLRVESASEAAMVANESAGLGLPHQTLRWTGWDGTGNLQDAARAARRSLIGRWKGDCAHVLMGHTQDDQAETLLMRLARGSGVDGLAAMGDRTFVPDDTAGGGWQILRPLLQISRAELRHYLNVLSIPYVDDPSNDDQSYARVRMRGLIGQEGLDIATLTATAQRMARAKEALSRRAFDMADRLVDPIWRGSGLTRLDRDGFTRLEAETQLRIMAAALQAASGAIYRPRANALDSALDRALGGGVTTLHGAMIVPQGDAIWIGREFAPVSDTQSIAGPDALWDRRWRLFGPDVNGLTVRALGEEGLSQASGRPRGSPPRALMQALPSVWDEGRLIGCRIPAIGLEFDQEYVPQRGELPQSLLAH